MSNLGWTEFDILNANLLYINGQPFTTYVSNLVSQDGLQQVEIDEIKAFLERLDLQITAPNTLTITNENRNSVLKTAIDNVISRLANIDSTSLSQMSELTNDNRNSVLKQLITSLETKLANINTTDLTVGSILTNDNRNSVLKTRLDSNDDTLTTLNIKTRYIKSIQGSNSTNPKTTAIFTTDFTAAPIPDKKEVLLTTHDFGKFFAMVSDANANPDDEKNKVWLANSYGLLEITGKNIKMEGEVNIGQFGVLTDRRPINIGGSMARINIGSVETPKTGSGFPIPDADFNDSTIITIGKRTATKNTWTYLNGNIYTSDSRFEDLNVTDVITWGTVASWSAGFVFSGVPYWLAWIGLSGLPNFRYSDVVKMANNYLTGGLTKNHSVETSNDLALKAITIVNTDLVSLSTPFDGLLNRLVFQAFSIHGSHSIGTIWGKVNMYCGSGEIELRNDGSVFDWAFKNAGNSNQLLIKNLDVELIQCNGGSNDGKLTLGACNGNIDLITGTNGVRANATKVMEIKSNKQVLIGSNSVMVDNTYKVLIDATTHTNGIKVAKGSEALLLNPTNVSSKSITLQDGYSGSTAKTLYTDNANLMYNGSQVATGSGYVKSINSGTGISITNLSGAVTINATAQAIDVNFGDIINYASTLPTKPYWYNTTYSWLAITSNVNSSDSYTDSWVSNTGQYHLLCASTDRIRYSIDWGVTYSNLLLSSFYFTGVCGTGTGKIK